MPHALKPNETIVLILFLVAIFAISFGWYLNRTCRRVIEVQVHEMQFQKDLEAQQQSAGAGGSAK
jgi:hypothetical protein